MGLSDLALISPWLGMRLHIDLRHGRICNKWLWTIIHVIFLHCLIVVANDWDILLDHIVVLDSSEVE